MVTGNYTWRKVIVFCGSQFISSQKISVITEDTADQDIARTERNVITTKPIKITFQRSLHVHVRHRYHDYYATFCFLPNLQLGGRTEIIL